MKSAAVVSKISTYLTLLLAFSLPIFVNFLPLLITLLVSSLILDSILTGKFRVKLHVPLLLLVGFYLFYLLRILVSKDKYSMDYALESKFSLFLFPLLVALKWDFFKEHVERILLLFILGCIVSCMVCLFGAFWDSIYYVSGSWHFNPYDPHQISWEYGGSHFKYSNLSYFLHPTYMAAYLLFAFVGGIHLLTKKVLVNRMLVKILYLSLPLFLLMIYLISSKAVILCTLMVLGFYAFQLFEQENKVLVKTFVLLLFLAIVFAGLQNPRFSSIYNALRNPKIVLNDSITGSVISRVHIWKAGAILVGSHFFTGVGPGETEKELTRQYQIFGYGELYRLKAGAHNQFLETFVDLGLAGFLLFLAIFIFPLKRALKQGNRLLLIFLFVVGFNLLFESMLGVMAGSIFFGFFYSLLGTLDEQNFQPGSLDFKWLERVKRN